MSDFRHEHTIKSVRKRHICEACDKYIQPREPAVRWVGTTDGQFGCVYYHPECRVAEIEYNDIIGSDFYEWTSLCDIEGEDYPWLKKEHPIVFLRRTSTRAEYLNYAV